MLGKKEDKGKEEELDRSGLIFRADLAFIVIMVLVIFLFLVPKNLYQRYASEKDEASRRSSESKRFKFSNFYHANDGVWILNDIKNDILKSPKYISPSERDEYLVKEILAGAQVRILQSDQRWKKVELLDERDNVIATGWIDANNVKKSIKRQETKMDEKTDK